MRAFALLAAAVLTSIAIGIGVVAGIGRSSPITTPKGAAALAAARRLPCWSGTAKLVATPRVAHPGEVIALDMLGSLSVALVGGNLTTFEAKTPAGWSAAYYLGSPGTTATGYGVLPFGPHAPFALVGTTSLAKVGVPDVRPGTYRLVRFYSSALQSAGASLGRFPAHGANFCTTVKVLPTPPALRGPNDIAVASHPSSGLHDGEHVRVLLRGFGSGGNVRLSECAFADLVTSLGCGVGLPAQALVTVGANGSASTTLVVHVEAAATPGVSQPSFACSTNCVLVATLGSGYAYADVALRFPQPGSATGRLLLTGGPWPGVTKPVPGAVSFTSASGTTSTTSTAPNGEFSLVLPPGRYLASGRSPNVHVNGREDPCRATARVTVAPGETSSVDVVCTVP